MQLGSHIIAPLLALLACITAVWATPGVSRGRRAAGFALFTLLLLFIAGGLFGRHYGALEAVAISLAWLMAGIPPVAFLQALRRRSAHRS